jgi:cysteinyl-tRNA synthetase
MLQIFNTRTRRMEPFEPTDPKAVRVYVCGVTVYDDCHLGHARMLVVFDLVVRYLRRLGYGVRYVRNLTDIDDKIIRRAAELGEPFDHLARRMIDRFHEDQEALGIAPPDVEPCATAHIEAMISLIDRLCTRGAAYQGANRDIYFRVARFPAYGTLSGRRLEELRVGSRIGIDETKEDPLDFVLWKAAKPGEPAWPSPWGSGRPGWHIECSAMSMALLELPIDIHGGGQDLEFPHHENEVAQSEAATGRPFVRYWIHNGFVQVGEDKMAKSQGNFMTIREALERYDPETLRLWLLASHYRSPVAFTGENLARARSSLERFYLALRGLPEPVGVDPAVFAPWESRFAAAMDDDFNTPDALAVLFDLAREINRVRAEDPMRASRLGAGLRELARVFGLLGSDAEVFLRGNRHGVSDEWVEDQMRERQRSREAGRYAEADRIRQTLLDAGILVEDGPGQQARWRRRPPSAS